MTETKQQLALAERNIEYTLRVHPRAKRVSLTVYQPGTLVVTVPQRVPQRVVADFLQQKSRWILKRLDEFTTLSPSLILPTRHGDYERVRGTAYALAEDRLKYFNQFYHFNYRSLAIKKHKTIWGSCSRRKKLHFNYKIVFLRSELVDYLVVHELCHLQEMNHSDRFWGLVQKTIPDFASRRKELKQIHLQ